MMQPERNRMDFAAGFAEGLLNPDAPVPGLVAGPAVKRYAVYRNNVSHSIAVALGEIFPAVQAHVGPDFFRALALTYLRTSPPKSKLLFEYGADFANFLQSFPPVANLPHLPDMARTERAWLDAFHAADCAPLDPARLAEINPDDLGSVRFVMHPAFRLLRSAFPAATLVSGLRAGNGIDDADLTLGEEAMITRAGLEVEMRILPAGAGTFFECLAAGGDLAEAAEIAAGAATGFDLSKALASAFQAGAFADIITPNITPNPPEDAA